MPKYRIGENLNMKTQIENIQEYYGSVLQSKNDLKTGACCTAESMPEYLRPILNEIHTEILDRFYGCGSPIPSALEGATVLDLGCGTGRDAYMLAKLVGPNGRVIGLDMTDEQLAAAGIDAGMIRFSVGLEIVDDILADIENAFTKVL